MNRIKKCPLVPTAYCNKKIHDPFSIIDEERDLSRMNLCPDSYDLGSSKPVAKPTQPLPIARERECDRREREYVQRKRECGEDTKKCEHPPRIVDSGIQKILLPKTNANGQALLLSKRLSVMRTFTLRITLHSTPSTIFEEPRHSFVGLQRLQTYEQERFCGRRPDAVSLVLLQSRC
jgi:hypothetical protein